MTAWFTAIRDIWLNGAKLASSDALEFLTGFSVVKDPVTGRIQVTNTGGGGGGGSGDVTGPGSSVVDRLVLMAGTTGKVIKQSTLLVGDLILRSGAVPFQADQSMGGHKLTTLANGSAASQDAATVAQMEAAIAAAVVGACGGGGDGFAFTFSATTADADPGAGTLRLNNATPASVTQIFVDLADTSSNDITAWLDRLDDSIGSVKGYIRVGSKSDKTKWLLYSLASVTTATGYRKLGVTYVAGPALPLTTAGDCFLSFESMGLIGLITNSLIDPAAAIAWSKLATAIGNLAFTGLKSLTYTGEVATTGATPAINFTLGDLQKTTLTANATPAFTPPAGVGPVLWHVVQDTTPRTITFPGTVLGSPPQPNTASGSHTFYGFLWDGTNYFYSSSVTVTAGNGLTGTTSLAVLAEDTSIAVGAGGVKVSSALPARGAENFALDLYPSSTPQGTIATATTVNFDVAVPAGKRVVITADVWVDNGAGGTCLYAKGLRIKAHITGGVAVKAADVTLDANFEGLGFTFTAAANSTNIRFALGNTSGSTRSYNVAIGSWSMDTP